MKIFGDGFLRPALDRQARRLQAAKPPSRIETLLTPDDLQRPVDARRRAEIGVAHAGRHHDDVAVLVDAEFADQLFQFAARVGSMNGTPLRVTRQPALS